MAAGSPIGSAEPIQHALSRCCEEYAYRILDAMAAVVVLMDTAGRVTWFNAALGEVGGLDRAEVSGRLFWDALVIPAEADAAISSFRQTVKRHSATRSRLRLPLDGGASRLVDWRISAFLDDSGHVSHVVGVGYDVSEEDGIVAGLQRDLDSLRHLVDHGNAKLAKAEDELARQIVDHKAAAAELKYRVAFENLITTLSTEFISLRPEEIDEGVERALRRIGEFTGDDRSWVVLYHNKMLQNTHEWCRTGIVSCKPYLDDVPIVTSPWVERLSRGEVVHVPRTYVSPAEANINIALFRKVGTKSTVMVPMVYRGKTIGSLGFDSVRRERAWSDETIVLLRAVGEMFVNALERKWVEEELQESRRALATERTRIAADLHDSVTQTLFSISMTAEALPVLLVDDPPEAQRSLTQLQLLTRQVLAEMRALLLELRPTALQEAGLDQLLGHLVQASMARGRMPIRLTIRGRSQLPPNVQVGLYRIAQEALNNVIRHAAAHSAEVGLQCGKRGVTLTVSDDGCGFDPGQVSGEHLGLAIMRERAASIDATLSVESRINGWTKVTARWPRADRGATNGRSRK